MIKRISKIIIIAFVFLFVFSLSACKGPKEEPKDPTISFDKTTYEVEVGDEVTLTPVVKDLDNAEVVYEESVSGVVSSTAAGKYTAVKAGTVTITATLKGYTVSASVTITVKEIVLVDSITIKGEASMTEGDTQTLSATVAPDNAKDKTFKWSSSNSKIATISDAGLVTALKAGTVTITATANDASAKTATFKIVIKEKQILATAIDFDIQEKYYVGDEDTLVAKFTPTNTSIKVAAWSSTNPTVATIDEDGKLVAVNAGKVTIVAKASDGSGVKASKQITVEEFNGPTEVKYVGPTTFGANETYQLKASDFSSDAKEALEFLSYECFDDTVSVSDAGLITAVSSGTANVIVSIQGKAKIELTIAVKVVPVLYVDASLAGSSNGASVTSSLTTDALTFGTNAFDTITKAIAKATDGAYILVAKGTYAENININKSNIILVGPNNKVLGNDTRQDEAVLTGIVNIAKELENITIAGFKFAESAQIKNAAGAAGSGDAPATNLDGFKFAYNLVDTSLSSGKGFIYFVEGSSGYSYNLYFTGNKFTTSVENSALEAFVYIDNNTHLFVENNTFYNAPKMAFYINDTTKGLGGNAIIKNNTFDTVGTNAFHSNWGSPSPNLTKGFYIEVEGNTFKSVGADAIHFGQFNNADSYDHIYVKNNTFNSVGTGVYFNRVQNDYHIAVTNNTFNNDPTTAYFVNGWNAASNTKMVAGGNKYLDNGVESTPKAALYDAEKVAIDQVPDGSSTEEREAALGNHVEIRFAGSGVLKVNENLDLEVNFFGETEGNAPTFASSDATIASVDATGKVTALKAGDATITVTISSTVATVSLNVIDESQTMNELLKLLALNNNGVVMNKVITLKGNSDIDKRTYGSVNNYWAGTMPTIKADYMPLSTKKYGVWEYSEDENIKPLKDQQLRLIQAERTSTDYIVVHDTANSSKGANAKMNSDWAHHEQEDTTASWHYTVGNDGIYQVLENEKLIAWHAGDGTNWALDNNNSTTFYDTGVAYSVERPTVTLGEDGYFYIEGAKTTVKYPTQAGVTPHLNDLGILAFKGENGNYVIPTTHITGENYGQAICMRGGNLNAVAIESCINSDADLYLTWQYLAKLVTSLLLKYNLTPDRVSFHNNWSNKPCPHTMMDANLVNQFLKMVYVEYDVAKNYSDYTITFTSNNPDIIDNTGRVVSWPTYTTNVSYTVTVTKGSESASMTLHSLVIGKNC